VPHTVVVDVMLILERDDVRAVHVMQHLNPEGQTRVGWFFTADRWAGEPYNAEPHKCARLLWAPVDHLPGNTWPYTAAGLAQYRAGTPFSLHGFAPGTRRRLAIGHPARDQTPPLPRPDGLRKPRQPPCLNARPWPWTADA
jgi:hypothetical protein